MANAQEALKKLFALSGNSCEFAGCDEKIIDYEYNMVTGKICHIKSNKPNSPRFNKQLTVEEFNAFENLLVLCPKHHKIVNSNPGEFTIEYLQKIKREHESKAGAKETVEDWVIEKLIETNKLS